MIIKKFIGKTEDDALAQAKAELGEEVVVMNVRQAVKKGLFGFLKKPQIEVTIAKEEENERYQYAAQARASEEASLRETFRQVARAAGMEKPEKPEKPIFDVKVDDKTQASGPAETAPDNSHTELVEKLDFLQNMIEQKLQPSEEETETEPEEEAEQESEMERFMKLLYNTMLDNEVGEKYANQIIDDMEKNVKPNMTFDHALGDVYQKMVLKFGKSLPIEKSGKAPRVIFFVGPTGVGKTTTIAKIASRLSVEQKRKVALLTADTYRIAAAEQLRTYAEILEIPFRVIYSVEEMERAIQDFKSCDYILVDTAGHSHQNTVLKESMGAFVHAAQKDAETEVHLVLSATTKYRDLVSIADTYSDIADYKIIFTKLDETTAYGNLLNVKLYTGKNLSYITYGQNVPDDIEIFNPQKAVKQLLGGGGSHR